MSNEVAASGEKFEPSGYNDVGFAAAFGVQSAAVLGWVVFAASSGRYLMEDAASQAAALLQGKAIVAKSTAESSQALGLLSLMGLVLAVFWAVAWMQLLRSFPVEMVKVSLVSFPVMCGIFALVCLAQGNMLGGIIFLIVAVLAAALIYFCLWERVEFTGKVCQGVSNIYNEASSIFMVAILAMVVQAVWMVVWLFAVIAKPNPLLFVLLLVSFYWGVQVISNILYVSAGGVVARYYFNKQKDEAVSMSTTHACTNYFGSICLGSLIIAVIQALRTCCQMAKDKAEEDGNDAAAACLCVLDCFMSCLESTAQIFNEFAFAYVAIYGKDFYTSGQMTIDLCTRDSFNAVLNNSLVGFVTFFGCVAGALVVCAFNSVLAWRAGLESDYVAGAAVIGLLLGFAIMCIVSRVVEAGCNTLFVCYAEEPEKLEVVADDALTSAFNECKKLNSKV